MSIYLALTLFSYLSGQCNVHFRSQSRVCRVWRLFRDSSFTVRSTTQSFIAYCIDGMMIVRRYNTASIIDVPTNPFTNRNLPQYA
jgi:hypothetical protein